MQLSFQFIWAGGLPSEYENGAPVCAHCKGPWTRESMRRHVYIVPKRDKPLSGSSFCSLKCLDVHLQEVENGAWCAFGESVAHQGAGQLTVHSIAVSERETSEHTFRHRDWLGNGSSLPAKPP